MKNVLNAFIGTVLVLGVSIITPLVYAARHKLCPHPQGLIENAIWAVLLLGSAWTFTRDSIIKKFFLLDYVQMILDLFKWVEKVLDKCLNTALRAIELGIIASIPLVTAFLLYKVLDVPHQSTTVQVVSFLHFVVSIIVGVVIIFKFAEEEIGFAELYDMFIEWLQKYKV